MQRSIDLAIVIRKFLVKVAVTTLAIVAGVYFLRAAVLFLDQSSHVYHPDSHWTATPQKEGLNYEEISFFASDGIGLSGWFVPAAGSARGLTVLVCHGNTGNISNGLPAIRLFHSLGLDVFIFDYRGYGHSEGKISEAGMYLDVEAAWRYLVDQRRILPKNIVISGRSLGAAVAARLAASHLSRSLILESGFTSIVDAAAELYPQFPVRWFLRYRYETLKNLRKVRCPVLIVHSREDTIVSFHHGQALYAAASEPKRFFEISGPHNEGYEIDEKEYKVVLEEFLSMGV